MGKWPYAKIIGMGVISATVITSIYSFLSNVDTLQVVPNGQFTSFYVHSGIGCLPTDYNVHDRNYCNSISQLMAINTTVIQWQCHLYTDYTSTKITDTFPPLKRCLNTIIAFAIIFSFFSIVHDCTLIHWCDKAKLKDVSFYPSQFRSDFNWTVETFNFLESQCGYDTMCCGTFITFIFIVVLVLEIIYTCTLYPFIYFLNDQPKHYSVCALSYISEFVVGVSRCFMVIFNVAILGWCLSGLVTSIRSFNPDRCTCACYYMLTYRDFYMLFFVGTVFMIKNVLFLKKWVEETIHVQFVLYLKEYSLPIAAAKLINPEDCTGEMMEALDVFTKANNANIKPNENSQVTIYSSTVNINDSNNEYNNLNDNVRKWQEGAFWVRFTLFSVSVFIGISAFSIALASSGGAYRFSGFWILLGVVGIIGSIVFEVYCLPYFQWKKFKQDAAWKEFKMNNPDKKCGFFSYAWICAKYVFMCITKCCKNTEFQKYLFENLRQ
eukprot:513444_1